MSGAPAYRTFLGHSPPSPRVRATLEHDTAHGAAAAGTDDADDAGDAGDVPRGRSRPRRAAAPPADPAPRPTR